MLEARDLMAAAIEAVQSRDLGAILNGGGLEPGAGPRLVTMPGQQELRFYPYTDSGNAERIVSRYGAEIRYCHPQKTWYIWDGCRWAPDRQGHMMAFAKNIARALYAEASKIEKQAEREACVEFARKCESTERKKAALVSAQSEPGIPVLPEHFDSDPHLLNCVNGTVDLRMRSCAPTAAKI